MGRGMLVALCTVCWIVPWAEAQEVDALDESKALKVARLCVEASRGLADLPVEVTPSVEDAVGIEGDKRAALVIPDAKLSVESIAAIGEGEIMPAGVMFLHRLAPLVVERALAERRQRVLTVSEGGQQAAISMWPLAVGKVGGQPVLLVYASGASPAIVTTLVMTDAASSHNVTLAAERAGDQRAAFVITVAGSYRAAIPVTRQD